MRTGKPGAYAKNYRPVLPEKMKAFIGPRLQMEFSVGLCAYEFF